MGSSPSAIVVRRAEPEDFEGFYRTFQDPESYSGTLQPPFPSREAWRKRLLEFKDSDLMLVALVDGEIVGNAGMHADASARRSHAMSVGLTVRPEHKGKGVGTALMQAICDAADKWMNVTRLELTVYTDNDRAIALYRRFGFEVEGTHSAYALRDGRCVDAHFMARVRPKG